jgi:polyhydroxyalkanoate synthesis regulator phasin
MTGVREAIEQAIVISIGAASLTRERAQSAVDELVRRGTVRAEDGRQMVDRLMARARGETGPATGLVGRVEEGLRSTLRDVGVVTRSEIEDLELRLAELEHRIRLLETQPVTAPAASEGVPPVSA